MSSEMMSCFLCLGGTGIGLVSYSESLVLRTLKDGIGFSLGFLRGLRQVKEKKDLFFVVSTADDPDFSSWLLSTLSDRTIRSVDLYDLLLEGEMFGPSSGRCPGEDTLTKGCCSSR